MMINKRQLIHSIVFEVGALTLFVLIFAPLLNHSLSELGLLGVGLSLLTVFLLYFYNQLFDHIMLKRTGSIIKSKLARVTHALVFELSLIVFTLPAVSWWLKIGLVNALWLEIAAITFLVLYTFSFHWVVDNYFSTRTTNS